MRKSARVWHAGSSGTTSYAPSRGPQGEVEVELEFIRELIAADERDATALRLREERRTDGRAATVHDSM